MAQAARSSRRGRDEHDVRRRTRSQRDEPDEVMEDEDEERSDEHTGSSDDDKGLFSQLKGVAVGAAVAALSPAIKKATTSAAEYAVKHGPELMQNTVLPKLEEAGGAKALAGGVLSKVSGDGEGDGVLSRLTGGGGGSATGGTGRGRRLPVQESIDIAAPVTVVYDQFTQFEDYPKFMHRVQSVSQSDDTHVKFQEKQWGVKREWEAEIVEQRPDERIVWESVSGLEHTGVVTFHELAPRLTRIEINLDMQPHGLVEKMGSGMRVSRRSVRSDLMRFKAYVEMQEEQTGSWRGEVDEGEVVGWEDEEDRGREDEEREDEEREDEGREEEPAGEEDEDELRPDDLEDYEVDEDEDEDEEEDEEAEEEEDEAPRRTTRARSGESRSSGSRSTGNGGSRSRGSGSGKASSRSSGNPRSRASSSGSRSRSSSSGSRSRSSSSGSKGKAGSTAKRSSGSRSKSQSKSR